MRRSSMSLQSGFALPYFEEYELVCIAQNLVEVIGDAPFLCPRGDEHVFEDRKYGCNVLRSRKSLSDHSDFFSIPCCHFRFFHVYLVTRAMDRSGRGSNRDPIVCAVESA